MRESIVRRYEAIRKGQITTHVVEQDERWQSYGEKEAICDD